MQNLTSKDIGNIIVDKIGKNVFWEEIEELLEDTERDIQKGIEIKDDICSYKEKTDRT